MTRIITVEEITRVEGNGAIEVEIEGNEVRSVRMRVLEGPRFFESLLTGISYEKVPDVVRRICAICTASHALASITAIEKAFKVEVTPQTRLLRDLLIHGEMVESHALHLFLLALPDVLGYTDIVAMTDKYAPQVKAALGLKAAGNMVHVALGGREIHGVNERVGGFSTIPSEGELQKIRDALASSKSAAKLAVELFAKSEAPTYTESENAYMALDPGERFGFLGESVLTSVGGSHPVEEYLGLTNERAVRHSNAKFSTYRGREFMVGSLPRVLLNGSKLEGDASALFRENRGKLRADNSLNNNLAQAVELLHAVDRSIEDIDRLLSDGVRKEVPMEVETKAGRGVGTVEAPRGLLYHDYTFDEEGRIVSANVITPTAQNLANIEKDYKIAAGRLVKESDDKIRASLEVIARAYDPCISCSVHLVRLS